MMNLREIAAKKLTEQLLGDCEEAYRRMWHNAKLTGKNCFPDFADDREQQWYYDTLSEDLSFMIKELAESVKEKFDFDWKIYSWGRGGATIAPDLGGNGNGHHFNNSLDTSIIADPWDLPDDDMLLAGDEGPAAWTDAYHTAKAYLEAFRYINEQVRQWSAADLVAWWEDMKKGNDWTFEDDPEEHDPEVCGCEYVGNNMWSCGHIDNDDLEEAAA